MSSACENYLRTKVSYDGCVAMHQYDDDFYEDEWRVFLGSRASLWGDNHDTIRLLDRQGRTIDVFTY
jgi:hypothetical protein